jgi:hypothetical protein
MRMRVLASTVLLLAGGAVLAAGPTYRWVDAQGQVHYSDRPVEGAVEVELPGITSYTPPAIDSAPQAPAETAAAPAAATEIPRPTGVRVTSPQPEETLWNLGGRLPVAVTVEPELSAGLKINLYLDGNRVVDGAPGRLAFELDGIERGEHSLSAAVEDEAGTEILRSEPIRFYVQQTSIQPQQAPTPQPRPRRP